MAKAVRLENLVKSFNNGNVLAVDDITIEIPEGSFTTIVGPSGCGKTTALRTIAGLETPTSGRIFSGENDITETPPQHRDLAMVFQNIALYPHMTVEENIGYGLKVKGMPKEERDTLIQEAAETLQITNQLKKMPAQLSGGQQQRVALGSVFVENPDILLLDEPMSDLDAKLKAELRVEVQRLHQEMDVTMIYVTHDQTEAMTMSDHIMLMDGGKIAQFGMPEELFHQPNSEYVAKFIGTPSTNILELATISRENELRVEGHGISIPASAFDQDLGPNQSVRLGIRPQYLTLQEGQHTFDVEVDVIELLGTEHVIHAYTDDGIPIDIVTDSLDGASSGEKLTVGFDSSDQFVFQTSKSDGSTSDSATVLKS